MVLCEVLLDRIEELLIGVARELRPTLAGGSPSLPVVVDHGQMTWFVAVWLHPLRPAEGVGRCYPGVHWPEKMQPLRWRYVS